MSLNRDIAGQTETEHAATITEQTEAIDALRSCFRNRSKPNCFETIEARFGGLS